MSGLSLHMHTITRASEFLMPLSSTYGYDEIHGNLASKRAEVGYRLLQPYFFCTLVVTCLQFASRCKNDARPYLLAYARLLSQGLNVKVGEFYLDVEDWLEKHHDALCCLGLERFEPLEELRVPALKMFLGLMRSPPAPRPRRFGYSMQTPLARLVREAAGGVIVSAAKAQSSNGTGRSR